MNLDVLNLSDKGEDEFGFLDDNAEKQMMLRKVIKYIAGPKNIYE